MHNPDTKDVVFLSWSGNLSQEVALAFQEQLTKLHPRPRRQNGKDDESRYYVSQSGIKSYEQWRPAVIDHLEAASHILVFLTKSNLRNLGWMMFETGWVLGQGGTVIPVFVDFNPRTLGADDPVTRLLHRYPLGHYQTYDAAPGSPEMVGRIVNDLISCRAIGRPSKAKLGFENFIKQELARRWSALLESPAEPDVLGLFHGDSELFASWADHLHHVVHFGRDALVHTLDSLGPVKGINSRLAHAIARASQVPLEGESAGVSSFEKPRLMEDIKVDSLVSDMLDRIVRVFEVILEEPARMGLRVCFRELHNDGCYHTTHRRGLSGRPAYGAESTRPWPSMFKKPERAVELLWNKVDFQEVESKKETPVCVLHLNGEHVPQVETTNRHKPESMLMGAILLKEQKYPHLKNNTDLSQAAMFGILCVSTTQPFAFTNAHERILQACNDALSSVVNTLLRVQMIQESKEGFHIAKE